MGGGGDGTGGGGSGSGDGEGDRGGGSEGGDVGGGESVPWLTGGLGEGAGSQHPSRMPPGATGQQSPPRAAHPG